MTKIILMTGCPGSGKSTIGHALAEKFTRCVHLQVDTIRESMVSGFAPPGEFTPEAIQQFKLARQVAIEWATIYANADINVIIDDVCIPESFTQHYAALDEHPNFAKVLLNPSRDALIERVTERGGPFAEFFIQEGLDYVLGMIEGIPKDGWLSVDSSNLSIDQTTQTIMKQLDLAETS